MTVSTETNSKFKFKYKSATQIDAKFRASQTADVSGNSNCQAYPPPPPHLPTKEPCAPSYKSGQQIIPNSDRNCKEGNPNSSPGATEKSMNTHAGAKANADDDEELDGEQKKIEHLTAKGAAKDLAEQRRRRRCQRRRRQRQQIKKQEKAAPPQISC